MTERERRLYYYKSVIKRHLHEIQDNIKEAKNDMEREYYKGRFSSQLSAFAKSLGIQKRFLERIITKNRNI